MPAPPADSTSAAAPPSTWLGVLTVVLTLVGWSSVPLFLRHFAEHIDAWTCNGWRYGFSALLWLPVLIVVALSRRGLPRGLWRAALVPGIVNAAGQVCFTWAHYRIDPGLLTFGLRSQLIFVAVGAWMLFPGERAIIRRPGYLIGSAMLFLGTAGAMVLGESVGETAHAEGVTLALLSGLLFAGYGLSVRKYMHNINSVLAFAAICQLTGLAMVGLMIGLGDQGGLSATAMPSYEITLLLLSAVIGIAVGHVFYYISIARLGVAVSAGVLQLQPFLVSIGSFFLFREMLSGMQWLGGTVAVAGAIIMLTVQRRISKRRRISQRPVEIAEGESGS